MLPFSATWMNPEGFMLNEISQRKINTVCITYMWNLKIKKVILTEIRV